jgi:hypothetical protein
MKRKFRSEYEALPSSEVATLQRPLKRAVPHGRSTWSGSIRVDDRIRTGDRLDHNQELYQLSYIHRGAPI